MLQFPRHPIRPNKGNTFSKGEFLKRMLLQDEDTQARAAVRMIMLCLPGLLPLIASHAEDADAFLRETDEVLALYSHDHLRLSIMIDHFGDYGHTWGHLGYNLILKGRNDTARALGLVHYALTQMVRNTIEIAFASNFVDDPVYTVNPGLCWMTMLFYAEILTAAANDLTKTAEVVLSAMDEAGFTRQEPKEDES